MENKTTTELLDLLGKLDKEIEKDEDGKFDYDKYDEVIEEIKTRYPFSEILGEHSDPNDFTLEERIDSLEADIKLLKRHKHEDKSGDVMIRI